MNNYLVKQVPAILRRGKSMMMNNPDFAYEHKIKAFERFECFPQMLLFCELKDYPETALVDALRHFVHRFPTFVIAFYQWPFLWTASARKDVSFLLTRDFDSREKALEWIKKECNEKIRERFAPLVSWDEKFYETFFDSQFISQRKNVSLQKRLMPMFFLNKNTPEFASMKKFRRTLPNTTLKRFE